MATPAKIEFKAADGIVLKGVLYDAGGKRPTIIMSNGFTGTKEAYLPSFAERFHAAGFTVVIYDNRNWGESEGLPRNESDPTMQTRDYLAAFDYAAALPSADASNIVYWGTSLSGGNAICAGALDQRIRAVISQVPFASGEMVTMGIGQRKAGFVLADRAKLARGEASMMIPVVPNSIEEVENGTSQAVLSTTDIFPFLAELDRREVKWEKFSTMQSLFYMQSHEPIAYVHRISPRPLLMVVGEHDECIPTNLQLKMFARAQEPKRVHVIRGAGHFDPYYGEKFEENIRVQLEFLRGLFGQSA